MNRVIVNVDMTDVIRELEDIVHDVETYPMELIAEGLVGAIDDEIESEGKGQWEPLSPNTIKRRPKRRFGALLQDIGPLANIQPAHGPDWAEAASSAPYAGFHITGTEHMPKRDWTDIDLDYVMEGFIDEIMEQAVTP
jgi:hypothetical protein